jgi:hypothetical protein
MTILGGKRGFLHIARSLVLALGLAFAFGSLPLDAAPVQACAVTGDCMLSPADEPREREETVFIVGVASESLQSETAQQMPAVLPPAAVFALQSLPPSGLDRDMRHIRGHEVLPDKTGPPRA